MPLIGLSFWLCRAVVGLFRLQKTDICLQFPDGFAGIAVRFVQKGDEAAAYDASRGMCTGGVEGGLVADAEAYHAGIAQLHILDFTEVGLLLCVKIVLGTCGSSRGNHVDETVGMGIDLTDAFFAGFGGDEHDDAEVVLLGDVFIMFFVIAEGKVGNDDAVDAARDTLLAEGFESVVQDGVQVAHQDERDADVAADVVQLFEQFAYRHAVAQCLSGCSLYDDAVGHRIAEGNADFDHVDTVFFECTDDVGSTFKAGATGTEIDGKQVVGIMLKKLIDAVHNNIFFIGLYINGG